MATAEFSKFAGILSEALYQHHLLGFEIAQLEFLHQIAPEKWRGWVKAKTVPSVDVTGDESKVWCCKEQHCIETWNVRPVSQGKLEVVKQDGKNEHWHFRNQKLKWTGKGHSDDHCIYYCGQECLRRNGVAIIVNKRVWNAVLRWNLKNDRMISVPFQGKSFNIMVIQV